MTNPYRSTHYPEPDTKTPRVAVRDQILELLAPQPAIVSTGGQPFLMLDASADNCYAVPMDPPSTRGWITVRHCSDGRPAPSDSQIRQALRVKEAEAFGGTSRNVRVPINLRCAYDSHYRIPTAEIDARGLVLREWLNAPAEPAFVLSLDTARGRQVAVTSSRWLIQPGQTAFVFHPLRQNLPDPLPPANDDPSAALLPFRQLLRLDHPRHDASWTTLLEWTLAALRGPKNAVFHQYPILNLMGPENSGKTVTAKLLTQLLDPTLTPVHSLPTTERRLHALAATHHILTFDDPGKLNPQKSGQLSRLASGVASLHPQHQGMLVRPMILTTTEEKQTAHLSGKIVDVELPPVENPLSPEEIQQKFDALHPQILGALLTLLMLRFDTPPPFLPNRKSRNQKIEETVTDFLQANADPETGAWTGTLGNLAKAMAAQNLIKEGELSPETLGRLLDRLKSIVVTRLQRTNRERRVRLEPSPAAAAKPAKPKPITRIIERVKSALGAVAAFTRPVTLEPAHYKRTPAFDFIHVHARPFAAQ